MRLIDSLVIPSWCQNPFRYTIKIKIITSIDLIYLVYSPTETYENWQIYTSAEFERFVSQVCVMLNPNGLLFERIVSEYIWKSYKLIV